MPQPEPDLSNSSLKGTALWLARVLGTYAMAGGAVSFLGWSLGVARLTDWEGNGVSTQPNTALAAFFAGLALFLHVSDRPRLAGRLAIVPALIGTATLFEHITSIDLRIDTLFLFGRHWGNELVVSPGRMGPPSALSWTLLGSALAVVGLAPRWRRVVPYLSMTAALIGTLTFVGYLFGADPLYTLPRLTAIAWQTSSFILAVGVGSTACVTDRQPAKALIERSSSGMLARRTLPFLVVTPIVIGLVRIYGQDAGLYDTAMGTATYALLLIVVMCVVLWRGVVAVGRHERELAAREIGNAHLSAIVESSADAIYTYDLGCVARSWNRSAELLYGYDADEIIGQSIEKIVPPSVREELHEVIIKAIRFRRPVMHLETRRTRKGGQEFDAMLTVSPIKSQQGEITMLSVIARDITGQKRAEELIAKSQKTFFDLVERAPFGVYVVDSDFRVAVLNKRSLDGTFANVRPVIGRDFSEAMRIIWPEPLATDLIGTFKHTLETGEPYFSSDFVSPRGDIGEVESYEWELHRIAMPDGRPAVVCYYYESTELRQAEMALREQQRFTSEIIEAAPSLTYIFDIESGRIVFVSSQVADVLGYTQAEIASMGSRVLEVLLHPDDAAKAAERFNRIMASETDRTFAIDYRMRHKDGRWVWLDDRARIFKRSDHGTPTQVLAVTTDITERKTFEDRVADSEERFRLASDAARALVYDVDLTGGRGVIAHGLERVTGFEPEDSDLSSEWWHSLIHPDDQPAHLINYNRFLEKGGTYRTAYRVRRKDGKEIWVEDTAQVTADAGGRPVRVIGTIVDITERRLAEEELRRGNEREKAARLDAEQANRAKDEFLAVLSHELRTPLHSIKGWISLLRGGTLDQGQQRQGLDVISRNVEAQNALIEDILDVSRIVLGKLGLEKETVSLSAVVRDAVDALRPVAEAAGIRLGVEIDADEMESQADPFRVRQIVSNLVNNAVKFTPYGGAVTVLFERDGETARLAVSDTGVGIAPDVLPRIFDRFEQADGSRRRKYAGLGLGLAIVKHMAELHGGTITAESSGENLGATFTVELPLRAAGSADIHTTNGHRATDGFERDKPLSGLAVLLVDDDPDALAMLEVALAAAGAATTAVASAAEAIDCLRQRSYDFLLSDLGMPEMDGFDLVRAVRGELSISPEAMPAMALSGYAGAQDREHSLACGYQLHSAKPVDLASLPDLILSLAGRGVAKAV